MKIATKFSKGRDGFVTGCLTDPSRSVSQTKSLAVVECAFHLNVQVCRLHCNCEGDELQTPCNLCAALHEGVYVRASICFLRP